MVAPIMAAGATKAAGSAEKALTGDVYVRRWKSTRGKGKKKREVEHELHANPLMLAIGAAAAGAAALALGGALWMGQRKLEKVANAEGETYKLMQIVVDVHDPVYEKIVVVDVPATTVPAVPATLIGYSCSCGSTIYYDEFVYEGTVDKWMAIHLPHGTITEIYTGGHDAYTIPAVTHEGTVLKTAAYTLVKTKRGIPIKKLEGAVIAPELLLTQTQRHARYFCLVDQDIQQTFDWGVRWWRTYKTYYRSSYQLGERAGFLQ